MEIKRVAVISLILFSSVLFAQGEDIKSKRTELSSLKDEISRLQNELSSQSKQEKESLDVIENYNKQSLLLNKLLNKMRSEERAKAVEIASLEKEIKEIEKEIENLKKSYSKYIVYVYKNGGSMDWSSIFSSGSINQALIRYKYLKKISEHKKEVLSGLKDSKTLLASKRKDVEKERNEKRELVAEKENEESSLKQKLNEKNSFLKKIRNSKTELSKELALKKQAEEDIRNLIANLIEKERQRKIEEQKRLAAAKKNKSAKTSASTEPAKTADEEDVIDPYTAYSGMESFTKLRGRLIWPISGGKVVRKFGENRHVKLNTVTINYGIDILAGKDTDVKAVAEGIVSAVEWVPGYGSVVIITHKDGFRTVFGHMAEIFVDEDFKVSRGDVIGRVGESLEGQVLHFEIWNERNNQNPESWLAKK